MNKWSLTREWISYLKRNQIAELQSDPETGKIKYRRDPTVEDLYKFLTMATDFDEAAAVNAIKMMLSRSAPSTARLANNQPSQPQQQNPQQGRSQQTAPRVGNRPPPVERIKEDFVDNPGQRLGEKDIELVFDMLLSQSNQAGQQSGQNAQSSQNGQNSQQIDPIKRKEDFRRIKDHIRTKMSPEDIMGLWRILKNG